MTPSAAAAAALRPVAAREQPHVGRASARRAFLRRSARAEQRSGSRCASATPARASGAVQHRAAAPLWGRRRAVGILSAFAAVALLPASPPARAESATFEGDGDDEVVAADASPAQREAAARLAANLAAKTAKRGGLARAVADGLAEPPSTSPLELGTALVTAAWVAGFAVVALLVQQRRSGGDDAS